MRKIIKIFYQLLWFLKHGRVKYFLSWVKSLNSKSSPIVKGIPWITFESERNIRKIVNQDSEVFEWGSGGSTIYFSNLAKNVVSVEHDKDWFIDVKNKITEKNINNCNYLLVEPESNNQDKLESIYISDSFDYKGVNFKKYCEIINYYPDNYFDIILVDGRARNGCIKNSINKLKVGGHLILDNSDRLSYNLGKRFLKNFKARDFYGPVPFNLAFSQTSIFEKKHE